MLDPVNLRTFQINLGPDNLEAGESIAYHATTLGAGLEIFEGGFKVGFGAWRGKQCNRLAARYPQWLLEVPWTKGHFQLPVLYAALDMGTCHGYGDDQRGTRLCGGPEVYLVFELVCSRRLANLKNQILLHPLHVRRFRAVHVCCTKAQRGKLDNRAFMDTMSNELSPKATGHAARKKRSSMRKAAELLPGLGNELSHVGIDPGVRQQRRRLDSGADTSASAGASSSSAGAVEAVVADPEWSSLEEVGRKVRTAVARLPPTVMATRKRPFSWAAPRQHSPSASAQADGAIGHHGTALWQRSANTAFSSGSTAPETSQSSFASPSKKSRTTPFG